MDFVYGIHPITEAVNAGKEIEKVFVASNLQGYSVKILISLLSEKRIPIQYVPQLKIDKLAPNNNQGVVAVLSAINYVPLDMVVSMAFESGKVPSFVILDRITDVRNFGAIVRTAECVGVDGIIIPNRGCAAINVDAIKTSAGALLSMNISREENLKSTIHFLKASGIMVVAASEKSTTLYSGVNFTVPTAIIMGSEEDGVSKEYIKLCDSVVSIPLFGKISSLNVSVACGIMLYEMVRQRNEQ